MFDVVIPLINNATQHTELRYALRSLEYIPHNDIYIIGDKPRWIKNIHHIPFIERSEKRHKEKNLYDKLMVACDDNRIGDPFVYFHDDHFLLPDFDITLNYCTGEFTAYGNYTTTVANTRSLYPNAKNFDVHCPMVMNKDLLRAAFKGVQWPSWGHMIKTMYAAYSNIEGFNHGDLKFRRPLASNYIRDAIEGRHFFSTDQNVIRTGGMMSMLKSLYPKASKYE
jgi:hypothetical protein